MSFASPACRPSNSPTAAHSPPQLPPTAGGMPGMFQPSAQRDPHVLPTTSSRAFTNGVGSSARAAVPQSAQGGPYLASPPGSASGHRTMPGDLPSSGPLSMRPVDHASVPIPAPGRPLSPVAVPSQQRSPRAPSLQSSWPAPSSAAPGRGESPHAPLMSQPIAPTGMLPSSPHTGALAPTLPQSLQPSALPLGPPGSFSYPWPVPGGKAPLDPPALEYEHYYLEKETKKFIALLVILGVITYLAMLSIPVVSAGVLFMDPNYRFWVGSRAPYEMFACALSAFILLVLTCFFLYKYAFGDLKRPGTVVHTICIFTALLGIMMILVTLPASKELYLISSRLSHGCSNTLPNSVTLMDYSIVLYNIRRQPSCGRKASIEDCDGWAENEYTNYMRYVEKEFDCGPLCPELPGFPAPPTVPQRGHVKSGSQPQAGNWIRPDWGSFLDETQHPESGAIGVGDYVRVSTNASLINALFTRTQHESHPGEPFVFKKQMRDMMGHLYRVLEVKEQGIVGLPSPDGSQNGVWYFPIASLQHAHGPQSQGKLGPMQATAVKLFSHGVTTMTCMPLISTRLQILAWGFGDLMFWEGLLMLGLSIFAGVVNFALVAQGLGKHYTLPKQY